MSHWQCQFGIDSTFISINIQAEFIESPRKAAAVDGEQNEEFDVEEVEPVKEEDNDEDEEEEREAANEVKQVRNISLIWIW